MIQYVTLHSDTTTIIKKHYITLMHLSIHARIPMDSESCSIAWICRVHDFSAVPLVRNLLVNLGNPYIFYGGRRSPSENRRLVVIPTGPAVWGGLKQPVFQIPWCNSGFSNSQLAHSPSFRCPLWATLFCMFRVKIRYPTLIVCFFSWFFPHKMNPWIVGVPLPSWWHNPSQWSGIISPVPRPS